MIYFDWTALMVALVAAVLLFYWQRRMGSGRPLLFFSDVAGFKAPTKWTRWRALAPDLFRYAALALFTLAFIGPYTVVKREESRQGAASLPTEGQAIYLILDRSGSMREEIARGESKLKRMLRVTEQFVRERTGDMIGVVGFARKADVVMPLTLDHQAVLAEIAGLDVVSEKEWDGTAIGYAIYKTVSVMESARHGLYDNIEGSRASYEIKGGVVIVVTDGFQDPHSADQGNPLRTMGIEEAARFAKEKGVHLYIINVEPKINTASYAAQRQMMAKAAELTGGAFFVADGNRGLEEVYSDIDRLEKSSFRIPDSSYDYDKRSFAPFFTVLAMLALLASVLFQTYLARSVP